MTQKELNEQLKERGWFVQRCADRDWNWMIFRMCYDALGGLQQIRCESPRKTRKEAFLAAVEGNFERGESALV